MCSPRKTSALNSKKQYERIKNPSPFVQFAGNDALPADRIVPRHKDRGLALSLRCLHIHHVIFLTETFLSHGICTQFKADADVPDFLL